MKKYLPHIALFVLGAVLSIMIYRAFVPKEQPDYKPIIKKLEEIEAAHYDSIRAILKERKGISRDSAIIIHKHEEIRSNLTDPVGDSLARAIIRKAVKQRFH